MTIKEVKEYLEKNANESVYIADELTKQGYGQTTGEYHDEARKLNVSDPTQKWHFTVSYYNNIKNVEGNPTYTRLHCPELLIWIAEVAGLNKTILSRAKEYLIAFEEKNHLNGTEKDGDYIQSIEKEFKNLLHINEINKIISDSMDWTEVMNKVGLIK